MEQSAPTPWWQDDRTSRTDDTPSSGRDHLDVARTHAEGLRTQSLDREAKRKSEYRRPLATTYRSHFKQRYMVETAWRNGGVCDARQITPDQGVVTSLHLTKKYIVVALDNAKIHVFDTVGDHQKTLQGHVMGVWAMVPWGDLLVSGGCDRDVRVWNLATGYVSLSPRLAYYRANLVQFSSIYITRSHIDRTMLENVRRQHSDFWLTRHYITHLGPQERSVQARSDWPPG